MFAHTRGDDVKHKRARPYRPLSNEKLERISRNLAAEWVNVEPYTHKAEGAATCEALIQNYNQRRPHTCIGGQTRSEHVHNLTGKYTELVANTMSVPGFTLVPWTLFFGLAGRLR